MIEIMARAMCAATCDNADIEVGYHCDCGFWRSRVAEAKAAQKAIRNPTPAMTKAGASMPLSVSTSYEEVSVLVYQANIDAMETESGDGN